MERNRASRTAEAAVAMRYVATLSPDCHVFGDEFAQIFLPWRWKLLLGTSWQRRLLAKFYEGLVPGMVGDVLIRARYVDDLLARHASAGPCQFVLLGAGWDSTALRHRELEDTLTVFELDHPLTHRAKKAKLASRGLATPNNVRAVPIDFERQSIGDALSEVDYDRDVFTLFLWGGVTFYLTRQAILATLADVAGSAAPTSEIVFDYLDSRLFEPRPAFRGARRLSNMAARRGEPFRAGFHPDELEDTLRGAHLQLLHHYVGVDQSRLYSAEETGCFPPCEYIHLAHARVPAPSSS